MRSRIDDNYLEIIIDVVIAIFLLSASLYALSLNSAYTALFGAIALALYVFYAKGHHLSKNIGANLENAHYLIIPAIAVIFIWIGALNVKESHSQWPIVAGISGAALYIRDAFEIYKSKMKF